jgi:hypothetical protein
MITTTFEEQLVKVINLLPPHQNIDDFGVVLNELPIRFNWGTQDKLNEFMSIIETDKSKYPLIWLVEDKDEEDDEFETIKRNAKIIIATQTLGVNRFNPEIYATDYASILNPIKNNLIKALKASGISRINPKYSVNRHKQYKWRENSNNNATTDIWNVIVLQIEITFDVTGRCLNKVNFQ